MQNIIFIGIILVLFTGSKLFAQQNTVTTNAKKDIYVPGLTKEEKAEKMQQEYVKQEEMKKKVVPVVETKTVINNENTPATTNEKTLNPVTIKKSLSDNKPVKVERKEVLINSSEIEKVRAIEIEKTDKK